MSGDTWPRGRGHEKGGGNEKFNFGAQSTRYSTAYGRPVAVRKERGRPGSVSSTAIDRQGRPSVPVTWPQKSGISACKDEETCELSAGLRDASAQVAVTRRHLDEGGVARLSTAVASSKACARRAGRPVVNHQGGSLSWQRTTSRGRTGEERRTSTRRALTS